MKRNKIKLIFVLSIFIFNALFVFLVLFSFCLIQRWHQKERTGLKEDAGKYVFEISNTGPEIQEKENVFERGYSTKRREEEKIRGQGLFIVKEVTNKYGGHITIKLIEQETTAFVVIPIKNQLL